MENIDILRKEANELLNKSNSLFDSGALSNACIELKKAVLKAEQIYRLTNETLDKNFLLDTYMKLGKFYSKIYYITLERKDILPACTYYEKIIYFYEDELKNSPINIINTLNKVLEAYVQLLWICLEIKDYKMFQRFIEKAYKHASKLARRSKTYEDKQYYILVNIFNGDYYKALNKLKKAYLYYTIAMNLINNIYKKVPSEGIKNDLILVYNNLSEVAKMLNRPKAKIKWDSLINELKNEREMNENA